MKKTKKPRRRWFRDMTTADYVLSVIGLCLGTAAALFPWHVYLNPESYGPPRMAFSRGGVIPEEEITAQNQADPGDPAGPVEDGNEVSGMVAVRPTRTLDPLTTGKVDRQATRSVTTDQPFPAKATTFKVLAVDGARALVGDSAGVYLVRLKSRLPDGTIAEEFRRDDKGWYIMTSNDKILRPE